MNEELLKSYEELKKNRNIINTIDPDFFFKIVDCLLKENEELRKENEELKEERQIVGIPVRNKRDRRIGIVLHQWENGSVAVLESINPRVINTHDSWNTLEIVTDEVKQTQTKCETIPVSLVKDKIEELNRKIDKSIDNSKGGLDEEFIEKAGELLTQKRILQELLEGRE